MVVRPFRRSAGPEIAAAWTTSATRFATREKANAPVAYLRTRRVSFGPNCQAGEIAGRTTNSHTGQTAATAAIPSRASQRATDSAHSGSAADAVSTAGGATMRTSASVPMVKGRYPCAVCPSTVERVRQRSE